jgi:hypothetical protein
MVEIIETTINEVISDTLFTLREKDKRYDKLMSDSTELLILVTDIIKEKLSEEERKTLERLYHLRFEISTVENRHLYEKGIKDSFKLYKWLQE